MSEKTFMFVVAGTISMHVEVKASTLEEAVEKAQEASTMSLCHQCSRVDEGKPCACQRSHCDPASSTLVEAYVDDEEIDQEEAKKAWAT